MSDHDGVMSAQQQREQAVQLQAQAVLTEEWRAFLQTEHLAEHLRQAAAFDEADGIEKLISATTKTDADMARHQIASARYFLRWFAEGESLLAQESQRTEPY